MAIGRSRPFGGTVAPVDSFKEGDIWATSSRFVRSFAPNAIGLCDVSGREHTNLTADRPALRRFRVAGGAKPREPEVNPPRRWRHAGCSVGSRMGLVVLTNIDVVEPDLLYFSNERAADVITRLHARGAPNLVVEVASPSTRGRDETIKRRLYEREGVDEYWMVDPETDVARV